MAKVKLSEKMASEMLYAADRSFQGLVSYAGSRTEDALLRRDMITYDHNVRDKDGDIHPYPVLTVAGWSFLRENYGVERPADDGRMTLEEAWADHTVTEEANRITAAKDQHHLHLSVKEALEQAYTPLGQATCEHGRGVDDTCDNCSDRAPTAGRCPHGYNRMLQSCPFCDGEQAYPEPLPVRDPGATLQGYEPSPESLDRVQDRVLERMREVLRENGPYLDIKIQTYHGVTVPEVIRQSWLTGYGAAWCRGVDSALEELLQNRPAPTEEANQ